MVEPFQLLVKPVAADCNLECGYCFYRPVNEMFGGDSPRHLMSDEVVERMIGDYLSHRFDVSVICWQGGEPTMAGIGFFERVVELEMKHGVGGQTLGNAFQTNGLLIDDNWARFFAEYQFLVGLSIDGPEEIHDSTRKTRSGRGSFDKAMSAAERFKQRGVAFNILTVVNSANENRAADVYRFFRSQGFNVLQFIPCLERDPKTGAPAEFSTTPEGFGRFMRDLFDEWIKDDPRSVSIRTFDCFMAAAATGEPDLCVYRKRCGNYLLVEHNGDVYPCDFFVEPEWRLGNIADKRLADFFAMKRWKEFSKRKMSLDESCGSCEWLKTCHGGCPKEWIDANKTYYCESYKKFFETAMLSIRRLVGR